LDRSSASKAEALIKRMPRHKKLDFFDWPKSRRITF
jgi:predicted GIY-YIG superfamily endonuclease